MARRGDADVPTSVDDKEVPEALEGAADRGWSDENDRDRGNERRGEGGRGVQREREGGRGADREGGRSDERDRDGSAGNEYTAKEDERRSEEKEEERQVEVKEKDGTEEPKSGAIPGKGVLRGEVSSPWHTCSNCAYLTHVCTHPSCQIIRVRPLTLIRFL